MAYEEQALVSGNEDKTRLIKDGFDVRCPECSFHYSHNSRTFRQRCLKCGYRWRVDSKGRPTNP